MREEKSRNNSDERDENKIYKYMCTGKEHSGGRVKYTSVCICF